jgi:site-specific DNA-cytosine methylase
VPPRLSEGLGVLVSDKIRQAQPDAARNPVGLAVERRRRSRQFSEGELKTVAGYPAAFKLAPADPRTIWRRIGNSVPPPMMMAIAAHLREISLL